MSYGLGAKSLAKYAWIGIREYRIRKKRLLRKINSAFSPSEWRILLIGEIKYLGAIVAIYVYEIPRE